MSLQALRRWIARHPLAWVLGLALALGGAQLAATAHELSHVASAASAHEGSHGEGDLHANAAHACATCLLVAALGGAAPAPAAIVLIAPPSVLPVVAQAEHSFAASVTLPYASRAPPTPSALVA